MNINTTNIDSNFMKKICRICLEQKSNLLSLYSKIDFGEENLVPANIPDMLGSLTAVVMQNNGLPTQICTKCVDLLKAAYIFKLKFEESCKILEGYISNCIKNEMKTVIFSRKPGINSDFENLNPIDECVNNGINNTEYPYLNNQVKITMNIKEICGKNTPQHCSTKNHVLYPCPICTLELSALELRQHAHTHTALKKYLDLPKENKNVQFYADPRYTTSLFNQADIVHKCPYCDESYPVQQFRTHVDNHRKQDQFQCDKCNRVFKKLNHLNTHRVKHLKEYPYKCDQCGKGFVIKTNYDCHILTHTNDVLPHECSYCFKRFSNPEHLNRHQIIHTENVSYSVKYKVCKCRQCLKTFKDKGDLKHHICVPVEQTSKARFLCKTCNKVFKHSSGLYNHIRNIHKLKTIKTLCSVCGSYVSNIYDHMMRHTGEKPYHCNLCNKRFVAKPQLRQHLLVHSGLKPYVCSACAKAFNNLYNLQVHERIHKGDRCHICPVCSKGFLEKSYLRKHMNVHKNIN